MALTRDLIVANAALAALTDEQIAAITTLSQNDEETVIGAKVGEIYGNLDADILTASGVAKNGTEKTYDYAKRVIADMKAQAGEAATLQTKITSLEKEKTRLEEVISKGAGDAEAVKALKQAKADLAAITTQFNELNTKHTEAAENYEKKLFGIKVDSALESASVGVKFKAGLPESVTRVVKEQVYEKIKGMNPELIDDGKGGQVMAFKDEKGAVLRNPGNKLEPYTVQELFLREMETMGVIDKGRYQPGGGTNPGPGDGNGKVLDISGARTRVEATEAISANLLAQGMPIGSAQYDEAMTQAWKDNNVSELPER